MEKVHNPGATVHREEREVMKQVIECCHKDSARWFVESVSAQRDSVFCHILQSVHQDCTAYSKGREINA